ncbi:response regulator [Clostridium sp.]|uniref:response regulator n=1 Tax=Clostridium sp. TaxID=1506 RepID=UPI00321650FF
MEKILIVDDNKQNCEIIKDLLSAWGYDVYVAVEGKEAINIAINLNPAVILLDVMLPGMNGFEVCGKLKSNSNTQNIFIIMLTVLNEVEDRIRGLNVGADVFLSKPIIFEELKNRVAWAINSKKAFDKMEHVDEVTKSLLKILKLKNNNLYLHVCSVKKYSEKVGKILTITDEAMERLLVGAYIHDIGKVISNGDDHVEIGEDIISSFKMCKWLKVFVRNHHEKINGQGFPDGLMENEMSLEMKILITINRFVEILEQTDDEDTSITKLSEECQKGYWSIEVLDAIKQVLKDEKFIKSIHYNKYNK